MQSCYLFSSELPSHSTNPTPQDQGTHTVVDFSHSNQSPLANDHAASSSRPSHPRSRLIHELAESDIDTDIDAGPSSSLRNSRQRRQQPQRPNGRDNSPSSYLPPRRMATEEAHQLYKSRTLPRLPFRLGTSRDIVARYKIPIPDAEDPEWQRFERLLARPVAFEGRRWCRRFDNTYYRGTVTYGLGVVKQSEPSIHVYQHQDLTSGPASGAALDPAQNGSSALAVDYEQDSPAYVTISNTNGVEIVENGDHTNGDSFNGDHMNGEAQDHNPLNDFDLGLQMADELLPWARHVNARPLFDPSDVDMLTPRKMPDYVLSQFQPEPRSSLEPVIHAEENGSQDGDVLLDYPNGLDSHGDLAVVAVPSQPNGNGYSHPQSSAATPTPASRFEDTIDLTLPAFNEAADADSSRLSAIYSTAIVDSTTQSNIDLTAQPLNGGRDTDGDSDRQIDGELNGDADKNSYDDDDDDDALYGDQAEPSRFELEFENTTPWRERERQRQ